jgi:hypothetical protein
MFNNLFPNLVPFIKKLKKYHTAKQATKKKKKAHAG